MLLNLVLSLETTVPKFNKAIYLQINYFMDIIYQNIEVPLFIYSFPQTSFTPYKSSLRIHNITCKKTNFEISMILAFLELNMRNKWDKNTLYNFSEYKRRPIPTFICYY